MGFYRNRILPNLLDLAMRNTLLTAYRTRVVGEARGRVVEIGIGSGLNIPFYRAEKVEELVGIDPNPGLLAMARPKAEAAGFPVELVEASAEALPFPGGRFDMAVITWSLCSIPDPSRALAEIRRVLRAGGMLLYAEHGLAPDRGSAFFQHALTPLWRRCAGGCHLDRPIDRLIQEAGFTLAQADAAYPEEGPPLIYMYEGRAAFVGNR